MGRVCGLTINRHSRRLSCLNRIKHKLNRHILRSPLCINIEEIIETDANNTMEPINLIRFSLMLIE